MDSFEKNLDFQKTWGSENKLVPKTSYIKFENLYNYYIYKKLK